MLLELLLALALSSRPARAYELSGSTWTWQTAPIEDPFYVASGSFRPEEVTEADLLAAIASAMNTWMEAGYDVSLTLGGVDDDATQDAEGVFRVLHGEEADMGGTLATTAIWSYPDGEAFDCDVLFLDWDDEGEIAWSADPGGPDEGSWDVESVALHELGHCLGLSHSADEDAIMYAKYTGQRTLGDDDLAGLDALYEPACADADGDGASSCAGDCDDRNALVSPLTAEICDGYDDNCNGAIDEVEGFVATLGGDGHDADWSELSVGNGFRVEAATTLRGARQRWEGPEGARLVWSLSRSDDGGRTWEILRSVRGEAVSGAWQQSPALDQPLAPGSTYALVLGSISTGVTMFYDKRPSLAAQGPIMPLGSLYGRAVGDQLTQPDDRYLVYQELTLTDVEDPDAICAGGDTGGAGGADSAAEDTGGGVLDNKLECGCATSEGQGGWAGLLGVLLGLLGWRRRLTAS